MEKDKPETIKNKLKGELFKSLICPLCMCTYLATCLFESKVVKFLHLNACFMICTSLQFSLAIF